MIGGIIQMFRIQNNNYLFQGSHPSYESAGSSLLKKNQQYRKNIRKHQIEQKIKSMRQEILSSLSQDYQKLKSINLTEVLNQFSKIDIKQIQKNWSEIENLTNDMFIYSRSNQSDHLYFMFDSKILSQLIVLLQVENIMYYKRNPRAYIRVLWILANYTVYSTEPMEKFEFILFRLFKQITGINEFYQSKRQYKIFTNSQSRLLLQIILFSLYNRTRQPQFLLSVCINKQEQRCFITVLINQLKKLIAFTSTNSIKETLIPSIITKLLHIFSNLLRYKDQDCQIQKKIYDLDFLIVNTMLDFLPILHKEDIQPTLQATITVNIQQFLLYNLQDKPEIILVHNFNFLFQMFTNVIDRLVSVSDKIFNYDNLLDIERQVKPTLTSFKKQGIQLEKQAIQLLSIFIVMSGLNFPQENDSEYCDIYWDWLQDYLIPAFKAIFKIKFLTSEEICMKCLQIINNICLDRDLYDSILDQLSIMSRIFYYVHSEAVGIRLKKAALKVLASVVSTILENQSQFRMENIEMLKKNRITQILARYIGEYVDQQLNKKMLKCLLLFLNTQAAESPEDHLMWRSFCQEDGVYKLQKYLDVVKNQQIQHLIEAILDSYNR